MPINDGSPRPERLVSLVPSLTELLGSLRLDKQTVGVTRFCTYPEGWKEAKTIVGGTKTVNIERVRSLRPDLVLANKEENKKEIVDQLREFAAVYVSLVDDLPSALDMIADVGRLTEREEEAHRLSEEIRQRFNALPSLAPIRAAYLIWKDPWMTVGADTFIHAMMARAGLENVFSDTTRYPSITLREIIQRKPDVMLLSSEPYPFNQDHCANLRGQLPDSRVEWVRGDLFSWYGSRLLRSPGYFKSLHDKIGVDL